MNTSTSTGIAGVHTAIAAYAHHLDAGRADDLVALFCDDGTSEIVGMARYSGYDELLAGYAAMTPRSAQLHLVGNTVVQQSGADEATARSDLAFFVRGEDGWDITLVGHYADVLHRVAGTWRFHERVLTLEM